jgi:hypothetical protein
MPEPGAPTRLPSREELRLVGSVCLFGMHLWAVPVYLRDLSIWLRFLEAGEVVGTSGYVFGFLLLESAAVAGVLTLLAALLPRKWFRQQFVPQALVWLTATLLFILPFHFNKWLFSMLASVERLLAFFAIWLVLYAAVLLFSGGALRRWAKARGALETLARNTQVLAALFFLLDAAAIAVIIARN